MTAHDTPRAGWLVMALGIVALAALGVFLALDGLRIGPIDEVWAYLAWLLSPFLAAGAGLVTGALLMLVAAFKLVEVAFSRAVKATAVGCLASPVMFVLSLVVLVDFLSSLEVEASWPLPWFVFVLPIAVGVATVLAYVQSEAHKDRPRPKHHEVRAGP